LKEVETANEELAKLREECSEHKFEKRLLSEQVGAVNMVSGSGIVAPHSPVTSIPSSSSSAS